MYTTKYTVHLADESTIEHHGKADVKAYQLCFTCAVKMITKGYVVEDEIIDNYYAYCDRCLEDIPENVY